LILTEDADAAAMVALLIDEEVPHLAARFDILSGSNDAWDMPLAQAENGRDVLYLLLSPGDEPGADALLELAVAGGQNPDADLLYGDEVRLSPVSGEKESFFKPDCISATTAGPSILPVPSASQPSAFIPALSIRWNGVRSASMPWRCGGT
jgi:hypothetical protein